MTTDTTKGRRGAPCLQQLSSDEQPIAALASGQAVAAVSIIRCTGQGCLEHLESILRPFGRRPWEERRLTLCRFMDDISGEIIDEPLAVVFRGPHSFTGQDSAEIHCHGGPYIVRRILETLYRQGFRAAEPGEFTKRAFLHGKLDLTRAEGIRELVEAQSHQQWMAARHLSTGRLAEAIVDLRREVIEAMAFLEAQIDFPDEGDTASVHMDQVRSRVKAVQNSVRRLRATYDNGRVASRGLKVALFGEPNAGKSTLMNELLGRQRAIVTPIAGTTRDYLEEECLVKGRLIRLVDLAGIREHPDEVERIGIESACRLAQEADLVVFLAAADGPPDILDRIARWRQELRVTKSLELVTKTDLGRPPWAADRLGLSCQSGEGVDAFVDRLAKEVDGHMAPLQEEAFVTSARHAAALDDASAALDAFFASDRESAFEECLAFELQTATRALEAIIGRVEADDVLDTVFSSFCIGK